MRDPIKDVPAEVLSDLRTSVAQLRHLYTRILGGHVGQHVQLANGLLAPEVRRIEKAIAKLEGRTPIDN
jgi:hypothetical protein